MYHDSNSESEVEFNAVCRSRIFEIQLAANFLCIFVVLKKVYLYPLAYP